MFLYQQFHLQQLHLSNGADTTKTVGMFSPAKPIILSAIEAPSVFAYII